MALKLLVLSGLPSVFGAQLPPLCNIPPVRPALPHRLCYSSSLGNGSNPRLKPHRKRIEWVVSLQIRQASAPRRPPSQANPNLTRPKGVVTDPTQYCCALIPLFTLCASYSIVQHYIGHLYTCSFEALVYFATCDHACDHGAPLTKSPPVCPNRNIRAMALAFHDVSPVGVQADSSDPRFLCNQCSDIRTS